MRICLVSTVFPPAIGGPSHQTQQLASALAQAGHGVTVVTLKHSERHADIVGAMHGARLVEAGEVRGSLFSKASWKLALARAVYHELRAERYDILHCQAGPSLAGWLIGQVAHLCRVPSLAKFPGDEVMMRVNARQRLCLDRERLYTLNWRTRFWRAVQVQALRAYTLIWAPSTFQRDNLLRLFGFPEDRVLLMPNYVNIDLWPRPQIVDVDRKAIVVCTCRMMALKGVDLLLQTYAKVPREVRGEFRLIGDGIPEVVVELHQWVDRLGLEDEVRFLGRVHPATIPDHFAQADIFFHTLLHRWAGIVFFEACAAGLCVVAQNLGSWPEQADFEIIPALVGRDTAATAQLLEKALRDPSLRQAYGRQAREYAARFDLRANLGAFLSAYERAIEAYGRKENRG